MFYCYKRENMSYTPTLLIKRQDLLSIEKELRDEVLWDDGIAKFLLEEMEFWDNRPLKFQGIEIVLCEPGFTSFNTSVRERLDEANIYYEISI